MKLGEYFGTKRFTERLENFFYYLGIALLSGLAEWGLVFVGMPLQGVREWINVLTAAALTAAIAALVFGFPFPKEPKSRR